jgi:hypothetical protein
LIIESRGITNEEQDHPDRRDVYMQYAYLGDELVDNSIKIG